MAYGIIPGPVQSDADGQGEGGLGGQGVLTRLFLTKSLPFVAVTLLYDDKATLASARCSVL